MEIFEARTPADFSAVRDLFEEYAASTKAEACFQDFSRELDGLQQMYGPPRGRLLLARADGALVACVGLRPLDTDTCEMKRLYVRPGARGKKLGRRLTVALIEWARTTGYRRMVLDTHASMRTAQALYLSLGFRETPPYYERRLEGVTCYELRLTQAGPCWMT